jgi:hypothetical protein
MVSTNVFAGETITTQEVDSYMYQDGEVGERSKGQYEVTYYIEGNTVTRTRVYDSFHKDVIPDNTIYQIQRQLSSDPIIENSHIPEPYRTIRAIGQPGKDSVEILMINDKYVQSVRSTGNYFIITSSKRIN